MSRPASTHGPDGEPLDRTFPADLVDTLAPLRTHGTSLVSTLVLVLGAAAAAYGWQLYRGLRVTGLNDLVFWGVYMANFVFFIGISYAGTLISAILRLTGAEWRRPITRVAEIITVVALSIGATMIILDMGRPDRVLNVVLYGRVQSPILWDVFSITTYLTGSFLYLYVASIPDFAVLANTPAACIDRPVRARLYRMLALGFTGTASQTRHLDRALGAMAVILIPVAVSAHSVVAWIFGMTLRPGWHSTIFAPYFVVGAIFSGTAALILVMAVFRKVYKLERYLTTLHFRRLGWILLALTLLYAYFTFSEYLTVWYGGEVAEGRLLSLLLGRTVFGAGFWLTALLGLAVPAVLLAAPGRSLRRIIIASAFVVVGMWVKRYLIVVPTLMTPLLPAEAAGLVPRYVPSLVEWGITAGGIAAFVMGFLLLTKLLPVVSIWEVGEPDAAAFARLRATVASNQGRKWEEGRAPVPTPPAVSRAPILAVVAALLLPAVLVAQAPAPAAPAPAVELFEETEGTERLLIAEVTRGGQPVEGVRVEFLVRRTFGLMSLGEDITIDDGSAGVDFPAGLAGDTAGKLDIVARLLPAEEFAGVEARLAADGERVARAGDPFPRALWSPRVPVGMMATIAALLAVVWGTYAYVVRKLMRIRQLAYKE